MIRCVILSLILVGSAFAQSTSVTITDSNGNQANGTINGSNVFFVDNDGNSTFGTIRGGNVFLNTSKGEITFGTIKNGNVFLTDQKGNTTGTIKNGYIFLNNSDGSTTTGTYNHLGNTTIINSTTTGIPAETTSAPDTTPISPQNQQPSAQYQDGYAIGQQLGTAIGSAIQVHRIKSACKKHADDVWRFPDGSFVTCSSVNAGHPVRQWPAQAALSRSANDLNREREGTQAWDMMEKLRSTLNDPNLTVQNLSESEKGVLAEARSSWNDMRDIFCKTFPGAGYMDLGNQQQYCPIR